MRVQFSSLARCCSTLGSWDQSQDDPGSATHGPALFSRPVRASVVVDCSSDEQANKTAFHPLPTLIASPGRPENGFGSLGLSRDSSGGKTKGISWSNTVECKASSCQPSMPPERDDPTSRQRFSGQPSLCGAGPVPHDHCRQGRRSGFWDQNSR
jgi:hypothetical protein